MPASRPIRRQRLAVGLAALASSLAVAVSAVLAGAASRPVGRGSAPGGIAVAQAASYRMRTGGPHPWLADPYSPAYGHPYRQGVLPDLARLARMRVWAGRYGAGNLGGYGLLRYGGGPDGIGVMTGHERVYLVFWGSQWGGQRRGTGAALTLSGDSAGEAPYLQRLFSGLGTGGETWSGVMTQYCQAVADGATSCPASSQHHVAYPAGGALAGVWADERGAAPGEATGHQLGAEAVRAAAHFGNATAASNRDAQYVIASPTRTHPDGFGTAAGNFCAWHDWTADATLTGGPVTSAYGGIAFMNLPYLTDAGPSCGADFVNAGRRGLLDGVSIVAGHEYAETITDTDPPAGWSTARGEEDADLCAWNTGPGNHAADLALPTGTFAMQPTWANDATSTAGSCEFRHAIVANGSGGGGGNTVTVAAPGNQRAARGSFVMLEIGASDSAAGQLLSYRAAGLPPGLTISATTGLIAGRPATAGDYRVTVTASDQTGAQGSASFTWMITSSPLGLAPAASLWPCAEFLAGCSIPAWSSRSSSSAGPAITQAADLPGLRARHGRSWPAWPSANSPRRAGAALRRSCRPASWSG